MRLSWRLVFRGLRPSPDWLQMKARSIQDKVLSGSRPSQDQVQIDSETELSLQGDEAKSRSNPNVYWVQMKARLSRDQVFNGVEAKSRSNPNAYWVQMKVTDQVFKRSKAQSSSTPNENPCRGQGFTSTSWLAPMSRLFARRRRKHFLPNFLHLKRKEKHYFNMLSVRTYLVKPKSKYKLPVSLRQVQVSTKKRENVSRHMGIMALYCK